MAELSSTSAADKQSDFMVKQLLADDQLPRASSPRISIEYVNGQYLVYSSTDASTMRRSYRIVPEAVGTNPAAPSDPMNCGSPFVLLPEQAMTLKQFVFELIVLLFLGYARIVRLRNELPEANCDLVPDVEGEVISESSNEELRKLATEIAKGRKAKAIKRELNQKSTAAELRIRNSDLSSIDVTQEEVDSVITQLSTQKNAPGAGSSVLKIPLNNPDESAYEEIEAESLRITPALKIRLITFRDLWKRGYFMTDGLKFGCDYLLYEGMPGEVHAKYLVKCVLSLSSLCPLDLAALSRVGSQVKKALILAIVAPDSMSPYYIYMAWWRN